MQRLLALVLVILCGANPIAFGGFSYSFEFDQANYNVAPGGGPISIQLLLREETNDGSTPRLAIGGENGFFQMGLNVNYATFTGGQSMFSTFTPAPGISEEGNPAVLSLVDNVQIQYFSADAINGLEVGAFGPNTTAIAVLGTFTFTNPNVIGVTTLTLSDRDPAIGFIDNIFTDGTSIDFSDAANNLFVSYGSSTITVAIAAVTEPTSLGIGGIAFGAFAIRRWKQKRKESAPV